ncbi:CHASE2 domain-containing sensor protein [Trinickia symbiotica]|nr:CHASE2 domain-containing sensor protein [Trinickia symbiotica]
MRRDNDMPRERRRFSGSRRSSGRARVAASMTLLARLIRSRLGPSLGRRFLLEWIATGCFGIAFVALSSSWRLTASLDHLVYDEFLALSTRPVSNDIVVVEIDDDSIEALGRWPWPRNIHARLIDTLAKDGAAAIVYDVLFTEPGADDAALARAIASSRTYLPILLDSPDAAGHRAAVLPIAELAHAAAGLGHINFEVDKDGIVRSVAPYEGDARAWWPQLTVPVWHAVETGVIHLAGMKKARRAAPDLAEMANPGGDQRLLIPFSPLRQTYRKVSVAQVLAGTVPPDVVRGRIVLVGSTASGLYDHFATPMSGRSGIMPGVYAHASVLDMLLNGTAIRPVSPLGLLAAWLLPLAALLVGFLVLSPMFSLALAIVLAGSALAVDAMLLHTLRLWVSPVPAILGLVAVYPVWSWRRLEMTMAYLRKELRHLADEPYLLPEAPTRQNEFMGDALEQQMSLMAQAARRARDMKRFVWDSLDNGPEPIFVADVNNVVLIANRAARAYCARLSAPGPEGWPLQAVLTDCAFSKTVGAEPEDELIARRDWPAVMNPTRPEYKRIMTNGIEVRCRDDRDYLLRYSECSNAFGEATGWIAGLVDTTALHEAERQREDALQLLSHDMRSPHASILALVEMERARIESEQVRNVMDRIARYATRALTLADDFVQLARAESQAYEFEPVNLADLVLDASDQVWPQAHAKRIRIDAELGDSEGCWIRADRSLLTRALVNILQNAIKYSPDDTRIACTILPASASLAGGHVSCSIRDQGYGIPLDKQGRLFERFRRFHAGERPEVGGAGLGMAFVKTVVVRHGGEVAVHSEQGKGTEFVISLPPLVEEAELGRADEPA